MRSLQDTGDQTAGGISNEILRRALYERVRRSGARVVSIVAPPGFGKSTFARQLAANYDSYTICDLFDVKSRTDVAERIIDSFSQESDRTQRLAEAKLSLFGSSYEPRAWTEFALSQWCARKSNSFLAVFENVESALQVDETRDFFGQLIRSSPHDRTIAICSRVALPFRMGRFAAPHEVFKVNARDLTFDTNDIAQIFAVPADSDDAREIHRLSAGWPVLALLLRKLSRERSIGDLNSLLGDESSSELYEYLLENFLNEMNREDLDAMLSAAIFETTLEGLNIYIPDFARRQDDLLGLPFVEVALDGIVRVHPLVQREIQHRQRDRMRDIARDTALRLEAAGDFLHAAWAALCAGDQPRAARALDQLAPFVYTDRFQDCAKIVPRLDPRIFAEYPNLWANTIPYRTFTISEQEHLQEARSVWLQLTTHSPASTRVAVLRDFAAILWETGKADEAMNLVSSELESVSIGEKPYHDVLALLQGYFNALSGQFSAAAAVRDEVPSTGETAYQRSRFLENLDAFRAVFDGRWDDAFALLEAAINRNRLRDNFPVLSYSYLNALAYAWFAGDDERVSVYLAGLESAVLPGMRRGFECVIAAFRNSDVVNNEGYEHASVRVLSYLIRAARADTVEKSRALAEAAVNLDSQHSDPLFKTCANIALAEFAISRDEIALKRALAHAQYVESETFQAALAEYMSNGTGIGPLAPFIQRLRRKRVTEQGSVRINVLEGTVLEHGASKRLPRKGRELLLYLAAHEQAVRSEELADVLWPDGDSVASSDSLRVTVYRVRKQFGSDVLVTSNGTYALAPTVATDIQDIVQVVRRYKKGGDRLPPDAVAKILNACSSRSDSGVEWAWYRETQQRVYELVRELVISCARVALAESDFETAATMARALVARDNCDEAARQILIETFFAQGDIASARVEYRRYRDVLRHELDAEPTVTLDQLMAKVGVT